MRKRALRLNGFVSKRMEESPCMESIRRALAVSGHIQNAKPGPLFPKMAGKCLAGHSWHDHIGDKQVDGAFTFLQHVQRLPAIPRFDHRIDAGYQEFSRHFSHVLLIFRKQNGPCAAGCFGISLFSAGRSTRGR